eukprot:RCo028980
MDDLRAAVADSIASGAGTLVRELWLVAAQIINLFVALILHIIYRPGHYDADAEPFELAEDRASEAESSTEEEDDIRILLQSMRAAAPGGSFLTGVWQRFVTLRALVSAPSVPTLDMRVEYLNFYDKVTSGFFEDLYMAIMAFIEHLRVGLRDFLLCGRVLAFGSHMLHGLPLLMPWNVFNVQMLDRRAAPAVVTGHGFPYERHQCCTEDGYNLVLERIPRPDSTHVVYFQHGIMDSSFGWVCGNNLRAPAFLAYEKGSDIFLGTMRGNGESFNPTEEQAPSQYWDFSVDDHGCYDVRAFVEKIKEIKQQELPPGTEFTITAVAHSLGAAAVLVYLVRCGLERRPHHLCRAVLLSPAGCHPSVPLSLLLMHYPLAFCSNVLGLNHIKITQDWVKAVIAKLGRDLHRHPATRTLMCFLAARYVVGGRASDLPLHSIHNLLFNMLHAGFSLKLHRHFWQFYCAQKFQAYDYGPRTNLKVYGSLEPLNYLQNYKVIDIPVHIVAGANDSLIPPICVLQHYYALRNYRPDAVFKVVSGGHCELTMNMTEEALHYVDKVLNESRPQAHDDSDSGA